MFKKIILITGHKGFIGKYLFSELKNKGYDVFGLSEEECDISNRESVDNFFRDKKIDIVFHTAAFVPNSQDLKENDKLFSVNVLGTFNLLQASLKNNVKRFVYSSSASVYSRKSNKNPVKEQNALPENIYGLTKLLGENLCEFFRDKYDLNTASLRCSSVYGFSQRPNSVLPIFINNAVLNKEIKILGKGKRTQDFIYVKDVVRANIKAGFSKSEGIFNIGSGKETSLADLAAMIILVFDKDKDLIKKEDLKQIDNSRFFMDISRAKKILKFDPSYSLKSGLEDYKKFYEGRNNI
jgi:UDP-glucose 4-epimerase